MYITVKGQATQKKPWQQGETAPQFCKWRSRERKRRLRELR